MTFLPWPIATPAGRATLSASHEEDELPFQSGPAAFVFTSEYFGRRDTAAADADAAGVPEPGSDPSRGRPLELFGFAPSSPQPQSPSAVIKLSSADEDDVPFGIVF